MERDGFRKPNQFGYGPDGYRMQIVIPAQDGYPPTLAGSSPRFPRGTGTQRYRLSRSPDSALIIHHAWMSNPEMSEDAEDLPGPRLPAVVEQYLDRERAWWRLLRATGAVTQEESAAALARWLSGDDYAGRWLNNGRERPSGWLNRSLS